MQLVNDGMLGNKVLGYSLGSIASALFSYMGAKTSLQDVIPSLMDYVYPPKTAEEKKREQQHLISERLLAFALRGGPR